MINRLVTLCSVLFVHVFSLSLTSYAEDESVAANPVTEVTLLFQALEPLHDFEQAGDSSWRYPTESPHYVNDTSGFFGIIPRPMGVALQRRNSLSGEPRLRGWRPGQFLTQIDGAVIQSTRPDMDVALNGVDPGVLSEFNVSQRGFEISRGSGFGLIELQTPGTPRFNSGFQSHRQTSVNYRTNGDQFWGRQSLWGGTPNWGFRVGYGHRGGSDYHTGGDDELPSSYKSRDIDLGLGLELTESTRLEVGYLRLDQTDVEYPGQLFDLDFHVRDLYSLRYTVMQNNLFDELSLETWYSQSRMEGTAQRDGKRVQIPELDQILFAGFTNANQMSAGYRIAGTLGSAVLTKVLGKPRV